MKTEIIIDHREVKNFEQLVEQLNVLLVPHGVRLRNRADRFADYLSLEASSRINPTPKAKR